MRTLLILAVTLSLIACGGSGGSDRSATTSSTNNEAPPTEQTPDSNTTPESQSFAAMVEADKARFSVLAVRSLDADGDQIGLTAYELIRELGGANNIESPDLYSINHPGTPHIYEANDPEIGDHFVFVLHRDDDRDRDREDITDRQRNEIKTYDKSEDEVLGFENETMHFTWKFRINDDMDISKRFSHFFQLKAVGGSDSQPVVTITGNESSSQDGMEIRHSPLDNDNRLARIDWSEVTGEWLEVYCRATFADEGNLRLIVSRISDGEILFNIDETNIDTWRGESSAHFVRPKWGIYRSLADASNLRADEEDVRFANFVVTKVLAN